MEIFKDYIIPIVAFLLTVANLTVIIKRGINTRDGAKKNKEESQKKIDKHEIDIDGLKTNLNEVSEKMNTLFEIMKIQTRQVLVSLCLDEIEKGCIDQYQLLAIEDLYSMYKDTLRGNSYVSTLVMKVRKLKVDVDG